MSFGATLTVTIDTVPKVLNRINQDNYGSEYLLREVLEEFRVRIRHSKEALKVGIAQFDRHNVEITHTVFATASDSQIVRQAYIVLRNAYNDNLTTAGYLVAGFVDYLDNPTVQGDLLTWQS